MNVERLLRIKQWFMGKVKVCLAVKSHDFILPRAVLIEFALVGITIALFVLKKHRKESDSIKGRLTGCM